MTHQHPDPEAVHEPDEAPGSACRLAAARALGDRAHRFDAESGEWEHLIRAMRGHQIGDITPATVRHEQAGIARTARHLDQLARHALTRLDLERAEHYAAAADQMLARAIAARRALTSIIATGQHPRHQHRRGEGRAA